ncbi:hypothetical protein [Streptomyces sp. NPDC002855]|uniref:hypothetical protein n=1 Tax=Streptomyces sp. NPDC002855 TaxID=3154437 RepID=UPI00332E1384
MTAVANATFNAADWNTHIRDNLLETEAAKATSAGKYLVSTGANALAARGTDGTRFFGVESTTSTSYVDLSTVVAVTATTGTKAMVFASAAMHHTTTNAFMATSIAVSGATTVAATDDWMICTDGVTENAQLTPDSHNRRGICHMFTGLNAGSNTFTMKHRVGSGTGYFHYREIAVLPL